MSGDLFNANFVAYQWDQMMKLLMNVDIFGLGIFGDGATIVKVPMMNILACSAGNPSCVLDVVDCTDHVAKWMPSSFASRCCLTCDRLIQRRIFLI